MMNKARLQIILFLGVTLLLGTCASERPISGGAEDKEAPHIVFATPENESVNIDTTIEIFIKFSEQMKKSTFESALKIWPRPAGGFKIKSGWTWLKVSFNKPLEPNETYLLTLDKGAMDLRGNGLQSTYVLAFSTGERLNAGRLAGSIYGSADIRKNGDLLLYRKFDTGLGELRKEAADYVFQPDDKGYFELPYLAERSYMLFYHWDRNRNKLIDGDDYFGRPDVASVQAKSDSVITIHQLWPHLIPLKKIKLLGVSHLAESYIQIRANRLVTRETLGSVELFIDGRRVPILGSEKVTEDEFAINMDIASQPRDSALVWIHNFQDSSGFSLNSDTLAIKAKAVFDTLGLEKMNVRWSTENNLKYPHESSEIFIGSNLPFIFKADSAFKLVDSKVDSVRIPGVLKKSTSMEWVFTPDSSLNGGERYLWEIQTQGTYTPLNTTPQDSLLKGSLSTVHPDSLGSIKIMQMGSIALQCHLFGKDLNLKFKLDPGTPTLLENLPAQSYSLTAYVDRDNNGRYSSGGLGPAAKAEPFWVYPDEIKVRARWETDLGIWRLKD